MRRDRLRRLEPAPGAHGGRVDPAHPGRAPDDRHRPGAALRGRQERDRVPDRARHGHEHVRAPGRQRARGRLLRPPPDPARPRRDPLDRGVGALADGAALHRGRLRPADGARAGADAGDRRRRVGGHQVRDQRPALAHAGRPADPGRDARGQAGSGRPPPSGSRKGPASAARWPSGWSRASPRSTCRRPTSRASTSTRRRVAHVRARASEGFNKTYGIVHPGEQWASNRDVRLSPFYERERELGAVFYETAGWERPHWYESNRAAGRGVRGRRPRGRVGLALVVADHQRRAPGDARPRRDLRPDRVLRLRHRRTGRARVGAARVRCGRWT